MYLIHIYISLFKLSYSILKATDYVTWVYKHRKTISKFTETRFNCMQNMQQLTVV